MKRCELWEGIVISLLSTFILAAYSSTALAVTEVVFEDSKFHYSESDPYDMNHGAAAISGEWAVLGFTQNDEAGKFVGAAVVFKEGEGGAWQQAATLFPSDAIPGSVFGQSLAIDGETIAIGAPGRASATSENRSGAVYVFRKGEGDNWIEEAILLSAKPSGALGHHVDVDGDTIITSAPYGRARRVFIFARDGNGEWQEQARLVAPEEGEDVNFGLDSVAVSGDVAIIGGSLDDKQLGAAYIYRRNGAGTWEFHQKLVASERTQNGGFGYTVAIDSDTAVIGTSNRGGESGSGSVYVFQRDSRGEWSEVDELIAQDAEPYDKFGHSLAVDGNVALIGAAEANFQGEGSGAAWIFVRTNGVWSEKARLLASDGKSGYNFAEEFDCVDLSSGRALVAATHADPNKGGAGYVFYLEQDVDEVEIDVKPFDPRNQIDPGSPELFSVAILSDPDFDALQTDLQTIRLEPGEVRARNYRVYDANRDRVPDLVPLFRARDLRIGCGETKVELTGKTHDGVEFHGTDVVRNRRCAR